jgi:DMSO reductase family type II enzyme chaperone
MGASALVVGRPPDVGDEDSLSLADLARHREATFRAAGQALLYPNAERLGAAAELAREPLDVAAGLSVLAGFGNWQRLLNGVIGLAESVTPALENRYNRLFSVAVRTVPCPPVESSYRGELDQAGWVLAELEREYAAAGLRVSSDVRTPPDHVAIELEFMALLCGHEVQAWGNGERESTTSLTRLLRREVDFLERHLGVWLPLFAARVAAEAPGSLYAQITDDITSFVQHDRYLVTALHQLSGAA